MVGIFEAPLMNSWAGNLSTSNRWMIIYEKMWPADLVTPLIWGTWPGSSTLIINYQFFILGLPSKRANTCMRSRWKWCQHQMRGQDGDGFLCIENESTSFVVEGRKHARKAPFIWAPIIHEFSHLLIDNRHALWFGTAHQDIRYEKSVLDCKSSSSGLWHISISRLCDKAIYQRIASHAYFKVGRQHTIVPSASHSYVLSSCHRP